MVEKRNIISQQKKGYIQRTYRNVAKIFKCRKTEGSKLGKQRGESLWALIVHIQQATRYSFEISDTKPELSMSNHMAVVVVHYGLSFFVALWFKAHGSCLN